jgi:2-amino-4-hydroxy-6-hydroxymethyldihydropteridine diphosphokinase
MSAKSVILLLGSNDVDAAGVVERAIAILNNAVGEVIKTSNEYRSEPYGFTSDREFVNRTVEITTELDAYELLRRINLIEALLGRDRATEMEIKSAMGEAYASRPIDIDIIFYGDETFSDERLTIPYHFLAEREYALRPLAEIAPMHHHPALNATPQQMLEALMHNK